MPAKIDDKLYSESLASKTSSISLNRLRNRGGSLLLSSLLLYFGWSNFLDSLKTLRTAEPKKPSHWLQAGFNLFSATVGSLSFILISLNVSIALQLAPYLFSGILAVNICQGAYLTASSLQASLVSTLPLESTEHLKQASSQGFNLLINLLSLPSNNTLVEAASTVSTAVGLVQLNLYEEEPLIVAEDLLKPLNSSYSLIASCLGGLVAKDEVEVAVSKPIRDPDTSTVVKQIDLSEEDSITQIQKTHPGFMKATSSIVEIDLKHNPSL